MISFLYVCVFCFNSSTTKSEHNYSHSKRLNIQKVDEHELFLQLRSTHYRTIPPLHFLDLSLQRRFGYSQTITLKRDPIHLAR